MDTAVVFSVAQSVEICLFKCVAKEETIACEREALAKWPMELIYASGKEKPGVLVVAFAARLPGRSWRFWYRAKEAGCFLDLDGLRPKWSSVQAGGTAEENGCGRSSGWNKIECAKEPREPK